MKKVTILLLFPLLLISGLAYGNAPSSVLGWGWSSDNSLPTGVNCLRLPAAPVYSGSSSGVVEAKHLIDIQDVKNQLNISASGHVAIGMFSGGDSAHFMKYIENDNVSETFVYRTTMSFKDANASPQPVFGDYLNSTGLAQWKAGPQQFREACGDSFVGQKHYGAFLYIVYQFHFLNQIDKQEFDDTFHASYANLGEFNVALQKEIDKLNLQGNIHVVAYQKGGDVSKLGEIFHSPNPFDPTPISRCSFSDMNDCDKVMQTIAQYAVNPTTGFPSQLTLTPGKEVPALAADVGSVLTNYDKLNPKYTTTSELTPQITAARDDIGSTYGTQSDMLQRTGFLLDELTGYPYVFDKMIDQLQTDETSLTDNLDLLQNTGYGCFQHISSCLTAYTTMKAELAKINQDDFILPEQITVNEVTGSGEKLSNIFVAVDKTPQPTNFIGAEFKPISAGPYTVTVLSNAPDIKIIKQDKTGAMVAVYEGVLEDQQGDYKGTVTYPSTGATAGSWTGKLLKVSTYTTK